MRCVGDRAAKDALFDGFAEVAKALASGRRAEIVDLLAQGERSVEELAASQHAHIQFGGRVEAYDYRFVLAWPHHVVDKLGGSFLLEPESLSNAVAGIDQDGQP